MRHYAIGDVHGHLDKLQSAMALIARDRDRGMTQKHPWCRSVILLIAARIQRA